MTYALSEDGALQVNGSFTNKEIGEGKYKLNAEGTGFGRTGAQGRAIDSPVPGQPYILNGHVYIDIRD